MSRRMKSSDLIANIFNANGINQFFGVQGGAVVHLFDSLHKNTKNRIIYTHHEQAAALAAVAAAKIQYKPSVCIVTTGPAGTNALTGLLAAWQDSVPTIFISGQTRKEQTSYGLPVRQRGSQECNILDVVKPWCKYTKLVTHESEIEEVIQEAIKHSKSGRPGPSWIDIPVDIQWQYVECKEPYIQLIEKHGQSYEEEEELNKCLDWLRNSQKPLIVFGRINYDEITLKKFKYYLCAKQIPSVNTWGSATITKGYPNNIGIIGVSGQPAANYAVRKSDCLVFIGSHFSVTQSGNSYQALTSNQAMIYVNIDQGELDNLSNKAETIAKIKMDGNIFLNKILDKCPELEKNYVNRESWNKHLKCVGDELSPWNAYTYHRDEKYLNPHEYISMLYSKLKEDDCVVIDGGGCALYAGHQNIPRSGKFQVICSTSLSAMGTGLPELCGVLSTHRKSKEKRNICIIGDGSLMFNLQELQTIKTNFSNATIIVINNDGYLAIRHTQKEFLQKKYYGTAGGDFGLEIASIKNIAKTLGYSYKKITRDDNIEKVIDLTLDKSDQHLIIELLVAPNHSNLYMASFKDDSKGSKVQQDLHLMKPFETYIFAE